MTTDIPTHEELKRIVREFVAGTWRGRLLAYIIDAERTAFQRDTLLRWHEAEHGEGAAAKRLAKEAAGEATHYPLGMGEESRRLHREYNRLVAEQNRGVQNGPEVVKLTDEAAAKGIVLVPGGENL